MKNLETLINELCPDGVEFVKLGDCCQILDSKRRPVSKAKRVAGDYPYYGANGIQDYVDSYLFDGIFLLLGEDGSVINKDKSPVLNWAVGKIWVNNHAHILAEKKEVASLRYLFFCLQGIDVSAIVRGTPPKLNQENLRNIEIPLPPIEVQNEIVRILDKFTSLEAELEAELDCRKRQYEYYRDKLLSFENVGGQNVTIGKIGDLGKICMCKRIMKNQTSSEGGIPFYKIGTFGKEADAYISNEVYEEYKRLYSYPKKGDVLMSAAGTIGRTVVFNGEPSYFQDSNIVWVDNDESKVLNSYLNYYYQIIEWKTQGGTIKRLYNNLLANAIIKYPSLAEQERIVSILDRFESLTTSLTAGLPAEIAARRQQYEHYRDKLLTFKRKSA